MWSVLFSSVLRGQDPPSEKPPKRTYKALLVTGGCCHDYEIQKKILTAGISERVADTIEWTVIHEGGGSSYVAIPFYSKPDWAKGFDVVVHNECFKNVKNKSFVDRILKPHKEGTPAMMIHCSMHSYPLDDDRWYELCGAVSKKNGSEHPFKVEAAEGVLEHPVMMGFQPWTTPKGELFLLEKVLPGSTVLTRSISEDTGKMNATSWVHHYGDKKARVFATTIGHHDETMQSGPYLDMVARGFLWAVNSLDKGSVEEVTISDPPPIQTTVPGDPMPVEMPTVSLPPEPAPVPDNSVLKLGNNLASGKPVMVSSSSGANVGSDAVDGRAETKWEPAGPAPSWWEIDLEGRREIGALAINWGKEALKSDYRIEASSNGREWKTLIEGGGAGEPTRVSLHEIDPGEVRYLRVDLAANQNGFHEFAVYDDPFRVPSGVKRLATGGKAIRQSNGTSVTIHQPLISSELEGSASSLRISKGFEASVFASSPDVNQVTDMIADLNGGLFVCQKDGTIKRVIDSDSDGAADQISDFVTGFSNPVGLEWDGEFLYVLDGSGLIKTKGDKDESTELLSGLPASGLRRMSLGGDGWLYVTVPFPGSPSIKSKNGNTVSLRTGGIVRIRRDGSDLHVYSEGVQSVGELAISSMLNVFGRGTSNHDLQWSAGLQQFTGLETHGYPLLFRNFGEDRVSPVSSYGGGEGVSSVWLDDPDFEGSGHGGLLSVDRSRHRLFLHELSFKNSRIEEKAQHEWASVRDPIDVTVGAGGSLYIAAGEIGKQFIASVRSIEGSPPEPIDLSKGGGENLLKYLSSDSLQKRLHTQWEILRRSRPPVDELRALALDEAASALTRVSALYTLAQIPGLKSMVSIVELTSDKDPQIRALAFRALGDLPEAGNHEAFDEIATEKNSEVIREMLVALARTKSNAGHLMIAAIGKVDHQDQLVSHTAVRVLTTLEASHVCFLVLDDPNHEDLWPGAMKALSFMHRPEVVQGLVDRLLDTRMAGVKIYGLKALARLYFREKASVEGTSESGEYKDLSGPYFSREEWEGTPVIQDVLERATYDKEVNQQVLLSELRRNHIEIVGVDRLISMAKDDPAIEPIVVADLIGRNPLPSESFSFLKEIAKSKIRDGNMRMQVAKALAESNDSSGAEVAMQVAAGGDAVDVSPEAKAMLEEALLKSPAMGRRIDSLLRTANGGSREPGRAAWAFLFSLHSRKDMKPEVRATIEAAVNSIDRNGENQQVRLMNMIGESGFQFGRSAVSKLLEASESEVVKTAAKEASGRLYSGVSEKEKRTISQMDEEEWRKEVISLKADSSKGRKIFDEAKCTSCHTVGASSPPRGPDLAGIAKGRSREELLEMILSPDDSIAKGYRTKLFFLKDVSEVSGFVSSEKGGIIDVWDSAGNVQKIDKKEIVNQSDLPISMMPPGLVDNLTVPELASLLAYLESLR